jgi:LysR family glycine cleavage system transcriptional activator
MPQLPLLALAAFHEVVQAGGVRAAARSLGIAHSAVSRRIGELERLVGAPVLEPRATPHSPVKLTAEGQALARSTRDAFALLEAGLSRQSRGSGSQAVVVSTTDSFATRWLIPRLPGFRETHPRTKVSVSVSADLLDLTREPVLVALRMGAGPWPGARPWMADVLLPVASPRLVRARKPLPLKALLDFPLLHDRDPNASWERWRDEIGPADLDTTTGEEFQSSHLVIESAAQGVGIALARARLVQPELKSGALVLPFGRYSLGLPQAYWIVTPPGVAPSPATRRFIQWLEAEARAPFVPTVA